MEYIGIIPARFASTRFPGKPLADIGGKPMIQRVYEQAQKVFPFVYVATDDERIRQAVEAFGGRVVMTSPNANSGTDRCAEAITKIQLDLGETVEIVVNIQGDEPFISPEQLKEVLYCFDTPEVQIATLAKQFTEGEDIYNPNHVKVVFSAEKDALYFSRSAIPYIRDKQHTTTEQSLFYKHIGLYAYRTEVLKQLARLQPSALERIESLEQLRWLENGYRIKIAITQHLTFSVDCPDDIETLREKGFF